MAFFTYIADDVNVEIKVKIPDDLFNTDRFEAALVVAEGKIINEAFDFWQTEAGQRLKTSREEYIKALEYTSTGIALNGGFLPYAVEMGTPGFSMAPGFQTLIGRNIPLNIDRVPVFTDAKVFRKARIGQPAQWKHPGFTGVHIAETVIEELRERIIPKYIDEALEVV